MKFEQASKELEAIASELESEKIPLEDSIALFEKGVRLSKECLDILSESQGKITVLKKQLNKLIETPLEIKTED
jgi:exodeoxyribonuclease VII small subunit